MVSSDVLQSPAGPVPMVHVYAHCHIAVLDFEKQECCEGTWSISFLHSRTCSGERKLQRKLFGQADKGLGDQHERSPRIFHRKVLFMEQAEFNKIASDLM